MKNMIRISLLLIFFLSLLALTQCKRFNKRTFNPIDRASIDSVIIELHDNPSQHSKKLTAVQVDELVKNINSAKPVGPYKGVVTYRFYIYQTKPLSKDTSTRFIMASESLFKFKHELGDDTFEVPDATLFERLSR
ncbi:MAG: hypothetical protein K1X91_01240 [Bacteriodetes bacterium]|nr:hypothetical protein [Bacteroidota bacterium]